MFLCSSTPLSTVCGDALDVSRLTENELCTSADVGLHVSLFICDIVPTLSSRRPDLSFLVQTFCFLG